MNFSFAKFSKAQMKMQQTAFMLVALILFFSMVALVYFAISFANLKERASQLNEKEALETVKMLSGVPELAFTSSSDCSSCVDLDKALILAEKKQRYQNFWNFENLEIEIVYPKPSNNEECKNGVNYPDCKRITLISKSSERKPKTAFITLALWDEKTNSFKYELGKLHATEKNLTR